MGKWIEQIREHLKRWRQFVTHDVWHIGKPGEEPPNGFTIKQVRVGILLAQNLVQDAMMLRASALTFATALAIVPCLAVLLFTFTTLNLDDLVLEPLNKKVTVWLGQAQSEDERSGNIGDSPDLTPGESGPGATTGPPESSGETPPPAEGGDVANEKWLQEALTLVLQGVGSGDKEVKGQSLEDPVEMVMDFVTEGERNMTAGFVGFFIMVYTALGLMRNIETSFNIIWGLKRRRSWFRMVSNYVMVLLLLPFLVAAMLAVNTALSLAPLEGWLRAVVRLAQFLFTALAFTGIYILVPNTKVVFRYAFLGGCAAAVLWSLLSWGYVEFQYGLRSASIVYGTFAQVPVLLMWIYFSWTILLLGAELSFAYQNEKTFSMERLSEGASQAYREALGLRLMLDIGNRFDSGSAGLSVSEAAEAWNVPTRILNDTLDHLGEAGLVAPCATEPVTYQPAKAIEKITVGDVATALREAGKDPSRLRDDEAFRPFLDDLTDMGQGFMASSIAELLPRFRTAASRASETND